MSCLAAVAHSCKRKEGLLWFKAILAVVWDPGSHTQTAQHGYGHFYWDRKIWREVSSLTLRNELSWTLMTVSIFAWEINFLNLSPVFVISKVRQEHSLHFQKQSGKTHVKISKWTQRQNSDPAPFEANSSQMKQARFPALVTPRPFENTQERQIHAETCQHFQIFYLGISFRSHWKVAASMTFRLHAKGHVKGTPLRCGYCLCHFMRFWRPIGWRQASGRLGSSWLIQADVLLLM